MDIRCNFCNQYCAEEHFIDNICPVCGNNQKVRNIEKEQALIKILETKEICYTCYHCYFVNSIFKCDITDIEINPVRCCTYYNKELM